MLNDKSKSGVSNANELIANLYWAAGALFIPPTALTDPDLVAGAVQSHATLSAQLGSHYHELLDLALGAIVEWVDNTRIEADPKEHINDTCPDCADYDCPIHCKILTPVQNAERNLRDVEAGVNIFGETPEELERRCQEWRAIIAAAKEAE